MSDNYKITSTSKFSAQVEDRVISETSTTRKILKSEIIENQKNPTAGIRASIIHQRKSGSTAWEDVEGKPLSGIKAGEAMKVSLDSAETKTLFDELTRLYAIHSEKGVVGGTSNYIVAREHEVIFTDAERGTYIKELLKRGYSAEVWKELADQDPDLADRLANHRLHKARADALLEFEDAIAKDHNESTWQDFFEKNDWIFGYGLDYRFIQKLATQPNYGGVHVSGRGSQRGDFLNVTAGEKKFVVLVEIKTPKAVLVSKEYRNGAWLVGADVAGGVSQIQVNCRQWEQEGSRAEANQDLSSEAHTIQPRGILVVGSLASLDTTAKRNTFELFRRNIANPVIVTFDELLERAKFIVSHTSPLEN